MQELWMVEAQILPVVTIMLLIELPGLLRNCLGLPYVPVYFALFPFNILNKDLSIYLGTDSFYGPVEPLTEAETKERWHEILRKAGLSLVIALGAIPLFGGALAAFMLPPSSFAGFCMVFLAYKAIGIIRSAKDFGTHGEVSLASMSLYIATYTAYFIVFLWLFYKAYVWFEGYVSDHDWAGLSSGLLDLIIVDFVLSVLLIGGLGTLLFYYISKLRRSYDTTIESSE